MIVRARLRAALEKILPVVVVVVVDVIAAFLCGWVAFVAVSWTLRSFERKNNFSQSGFFVGVWSRGDSRVRGRGADLLVWVVVNKSRLFLCVFAKQAIPVSSNYYFLIVC